ncbi:large ribosomal subunit protein eL22-like [Palaemon carinicauda]|uniref:large ribosomal subunit protein eL22-like n=1 Tax=Palaemon carinicauda TaxID=392227 RepID=UPI0035B57E2D
MADNVFLDSASAMGLIFLWTIKVGNCIQPSRKISVLTDEPGNGMLSEDEDIVQEEELADVRSLTITNPNGDLDKLSLQLELEKMKMQAATAAATAAAEVEERKAVAAERAATTAAEEEERKAAAAERAATAAAEVQERKAAAAEQAATAAAELEERKAAAAERTAAAAASLEHTAKNLNWPQDKWYLIIQNSLTAVSPGDVVQEECLAVTRSSIKDTPTESSSNPLPVSEPMDFNELMISPLREKNQRPYTITQRISPTNYIIATPDKRKLKALEEELWHYKEREQMFIVKKERLLVENERLNWENEAMQKELSEELGNKRESSSDDSSENERDVCKTVFMREGTSV